jgi:hypothetical protein
VATYWDSGRCSQGDGEVGLTVETGLVSYNFLDPKYFSRHVLIIRVHVWLRKLPKRGSTKFAEVCRSSPLPPSSSYPFEEEQISDDQPIVRDYKYIKSSPGMLLNLKAMMITSWKYDTVIPAIDQRLIL